MRSWEGQQGILGGWGWTGEAWHGRGLMWVRVQEIFSIGWTLGEFMKRIKLDFEDQDERRRVVSVSGGEIDFRLLLRRRVGDAEGRCGGESALDKPGPLY